tara:strand:- start:36 stop:152 length:117 start_codon:yes stop_codon:yes gene_type:complete
MFFCASGESESEKLKLRKIARFKFFSTQKLLLLNMENI